MRLLSSDCVYKCLVYCLTHFPLFPAKSLVLRGYINTASPQGRTPGPRRPSAEPRGRPSYNLREAPRTTVRTRDTPARSRADSARPHGVGWSGQRRRGECPSSEGAFLSGWPLSRRVHEYHSSVKILLTFS